MKETRSRSELRAALSGLPPDELKAMQEARAVVQPSAPLLYRGEPVTWRVIQGYALAPLVGALMGCVAMILVFALLPSFALPGLDDQTRVLRMATAFGVILSLSPLLAAAAMFALGHGGAYQVALAVALSWSVFGSSGWVAQTLQQTLAVVPPEWLISAAAL